MKLNKTLKDINPIPYNTRLCACGEVITPLKQPHADELSGYLEEKGVYTSSGFIKGIFSLNKLKKVKYGFSTEKFGNMAFRYGEINEVVNNRSNFIKSAGMDIHDAVFMRPSHGTNIEVVTKEHKERGAFMPGTSVGPADGLITFNKGVALGLNSADCVPLIFTNKKASVLGLVHAGRRGTDAKIARNMVKKLAALGIKPGDLIVGVGPSIQKPCYKLEYLETNKPYHWMPWVSPILKTSTLEVEKKGAKFHIKASKGKILVDIIGFNIAQLLEAGVKSKNIDITPVCALCLARRGEIFSHYLSAQYQHSKLFPEGRFMTIAQLN